MEHTIYYWQSQRLQTFMTELGRHTQKKFNCKKKKKKKTNKSCRNVETWFWKSCSVFLDFAFVHVPHFKTIMKCDLLS